MDFSLRSATDLLQRVEAETGLLTRIRSSSEAKTEVYASYWQPLITAVADYVQECPLEQTCFSEPGGLLRYALMSGYYALQIGNQQFFTGKHGAERRRVLVPQYRFAVFFSTLAGIPATMHSRVIIRASDKIWTPFHSKPAIQDWVRAIGASRYSIEWRMAELKVSNANAVAWAADIVGIGTWQNLAEEVAMLAHDAIYQVESKNGESPVTTCVRQAYRAARDFETRAMTGHYQKTAIPEGVTPGTVERFGEGLGISTTSAVSQASPGSSKPASSEQQRSLGTVESGDTTLVAATSTPNTDRLPMDEPPKTPPTPNYPDIILDIFKAIRAREDYDQIRKSCNEIDKGIVVPTTIFAKHGLPASTVLQILEQNSLVVEISESRKSLILQKAARPLLFG